ncbi:MAG: sterol desaturase family protein [Saprospiraceae bacterium]|jgi:alkylglycerol monooxygenase|nr:sterol desaturase family protein [Saprospiraceae bacterium]
MEVYGKILLVAMPAFLVLVLFEKWYGWFRGRDTYGHLDMISSLSSGITNVVKDVLGLSISILSYRWLVDRVAVYQVEDTFLTYFVAFMALDFSGYWTHRLAHEVNFFWNKHAIHHSSEEFNLACALRQSISSFVNLFTILLLPAALLGVPPQVIGVVAPLHLFAQFWYHTRHIGKLGFLEHIIVTPSHHRVHHAINPEYLDKNHGQIFIFWDKLFGTFQEELPDVPPVYGITRPMRTWNPIRINFMHLWLLVRDAWRAGSWRDKLRIWFMPTGWRPADVDIHYPVNKIEDVYNFERYAPPVSGPLKAWSGIQMAAVFIFVMYMFGNLAVIGSPGIFLYGAFIFLSVHAYTELMDRNRYAIWWELLKNSYGLALILSSGDWFGLNSFIPGGAVAVSVWFAVTTLVTWWFVVRETEKNVPELQL